MRLFVIILLAQLFIAGCHSNKPQIDACPIVPNLRNNLDVFDLRERHPETEKYDYSELSYSQQKSMLQDAHGVGCCIEASSVRDSTYVGSYYYGYSAILSRHSNQLCHAIVHSSMDDFEGLYLVLKSKEGIFSNLFVAGMEGTGGTEDGMYFEPQNTVGRFLNDSLIQTKTGWTWRAFRASKERSFTDTAIRIFKVDYSNSKFILQKIDSTHTTLNTFFD